MTPSSFPQLCDLYENDCIFDKFDCCLSGDGQHVASGSYSNLYRVFGCSNGSDVVLESSRDPLRRRLQAPQRVRADEPLLTPLPLASLPCPPLNSDPMTPKPLPFRGPCSDPPPPPSRCPLPSPPSPRKSRMHPALGLLVVAQVGLPGGEVTAALDRGPPPFPRALPLIP